MFLKCLDYMREKLKTISDEFHKQNPKTKSLDDSILFVTIHEAVLCAIAENIIEWNYLTVVSSQNIKILEV